MDCSIWPATWPNGWRIGTILIITERLPFGPHRAGTRGHQGHAWWIVAQTRREFTCDGSGLGNDGQSSERNRLPVRQGCALGFALRAHHTIGKDNQGVIRFSTRHGGEQGIKESFQRQQSSMIRRKHALLAENG